MRHSFGLPKRHRLRTTALLGSWALILAAIVVIAGCGDTFVTIWVRNESAQSVLVSITDGPNGSPTTVYVAGPGVVGTTLTRGGTFKGMVKVLDGSCRTVAELDADGQVFVVEIAGSGDASIISYDDAFPGHGRDSNGAALPRASECLNGYPLP